MKQFFRTVLFLIFINTIIFASNKIVIGSFEDKNSADIYLEKVLKILKHNEKIIEIQSTNNLYFSVRKSLGFYIVVFEPFEDYKTLKIALKEIKKVSSGAYFSSIKIKDTSTEEKRTLPLIVKQQQIIKKARVPTPEKITKITKNIESKKVLKEENYLDKIGVTNMEAIKYSIPLLFVLVIYIFSFYWFTRDKKENFTQVKIFKNKQESYDEAVDEFIYKYYYSKTVIKEMMKSHEYEEVEELITAIKKSASVLGAGKLIDCTRVFEGYFNDKSLNKASLPMDDLFEVIEETLMVMQRYREE